MRPLVRPLLVVAVGVLAARCHEAPVTAPHPITSLPRQLSVAEHGLIAADNQFAFKLFREIARQAGPDSNLFISPLSAAMALGMAYNGAGGATRDEMQRSEEHTSELQSLAYLVCRLLLEKKKKHASQEFCVTY